MLSQRLRLMSLLMDDGRPLATQNRTLGRGQCCIGDLCFVVKTLFDWTPGTMLAKPDKVGTYPDELIQMSRCLILAIMLEQQMSYYHSYNRCSPAAPLSLILLIAHDYGPAIWTFVFGLYRRLLSVELPVRW